MRKWFIFVMLLVSTISASGQDWEFWKPDVIHHIDIVRTNYVDWMDTADWVDAHSNAFIDVTNWLATVSNDIDYVLSRTSAWDNAATWVEDNSNTFTTISNWVFSSTGGLAYVFSRTSIWDQAAIDATFATNFIATNWFFAATNLDYFLSIHGSNSMLADLNFGNNYGTNFFGAFSGPNNPIEFVSGSNSFWYPDANAAYSLHIGWVGAPLALAGDMLGSPPFAVRRWLGISLVSLTNVLHCDVYRAWDGAAIDTATDIARGSTNIFVRGIHMATADEHTDWLLDLGFYTNWTVTLTEGTQNVAAVTNNDFYVVVRTNYSTGTNGYYSQAFDTNDLASGWLSVTHSFGVAAVTYIVYDNSNLQVIPSAVSNSSTTVLSIDLSGNGDINGTWTAVVMAGGDAVRSIGSLNDVISVWDADTNWLFHVSPDGSTTICVKKASGSATNFLIEAGLL